MAANDASDVIIRDAREDDLHRILAITNDAILHTTALWTVTAATLEGRRDWMRDRLSAGFPVVVAERNGDVVGFGSFGTFRPHDGYLHTVEHSLYVDAPARGRGIGPLILQALIDRALAQGRHVMVGGIAADNAASIQLHEQFGFRRGGVLPEVGRKFGRWLDLLFMFRILGDASPD
ncbi:GNAT family N-acetyltransferase [Rhizosaccharibacter radicis]|uniref:GNAT family N-acetyltransferase n=1 Tax=Rhizosaccharibacter radicis TaxID=2782605 RepID=A0ABT1VWE5_9PROT|nr:GNAT family N-acetyltransferase [Acetobacteraceae bacterium KSS12]